MWHKVILDILALACSNKDKSVHYYEVIKVAAEAGLKHQHLANAHRVAEIQGEIPVAAKRYSEIVRLQLTRKFRSGVASHAVSQEWKEVIEEHWKSISRVAPHDQFVVKRKTAKAQQSILSYIINNIQSKKRGTYSNRFIQDFPLS